MVITFFERLTFIFIFFIKKHYLHLSEAKEKDNKIPVENHTTQSDYVYTEIFSSKVPHFVTHTAIR